MWCKFIFFISCVTQKVCKDEKCSIGEFVTSGNSYMFQCDGQGRGTGHDQFIWFVNVIYVYIRKLLPKRLSF